MAPEFDSTFPLHTLREYALLADGERGILVGPRGDLVWMCFPNWDSPGIFSTLMGGSGVYAVGPSERSVWGGFYEEGSLIWHGRWVTDTGSIIECRDALALPAHPNRAVVLRRVIAHRGTARMRLVLNPRGEFGRQPWTSLRVDEQGVWSGRIGETHLQLAGAEKATPYTDRHRGKALVYEFELDHGTEHELVLVPDQRVPEQPPPAEDLAWAGTEAAWAQRVPRFPGMYARRDARHAYAILSGLTCQSSGMVAAATTSLPERASEGRNYDYRYVWIRDRCYAGQAVATAGPYALLDDAVSS